jgi:S-adenosylmethionine-dependent methyltransferase
VPSSAPTWSSAAALDGSVRTAVVWDALRSVLPERAVDVLDLGGGTGGFAVPLALLGHRVTVVDPSPDALAALRRRADDTGATVQAVQGDAAGLLDVVQPASADLVLCHGVLEHVDEVTPALGSVAEVLRPGGALSLLVAHRNAVVLARAVAGRFAEARVALTADDGRWGPADPLPRRFTESGIREAVAAVGVHVLEVHGVPTLADLLPAAMVDSDPDTTAELVELERLAAGMPELRAFATSLHVLARRS